MRQRISWIQQKVAGHSCPQLERIRDELRCNCELQFYSSISRAMETKLCDHIVVAVARPGLLDIENVKRIDERLNKDATDSSLALLLGDWCCGQKRILPKDLPAQVCYAHELLPERAFDQLFVDQANSSSTNSVAIYARSHSYRAAIREEVADLGCCVVELQFGDNVGVDGIETVIWEVAPAQDERQWELEELQSRHPNAKIKALMTFPREHEIMELHSLGIQVLAQPFDVTNLHRILAGSPEPQMSLRLTA